VDGVNSSCWSDDLGFPMLDDGCCASSLYCDERDGNDKITIERGNLNGKLVY
jgi:hypothetical protein